MNFNKDMLLAEMRGMVDFLKDCQEEDGEFAKVSAKVMEKRIAEFIEKIRKL